MKVPFPAADVERMVMSKRSDWVFLDIDEDYIDRQMPQARGIVQSGFILAFSKEGFPKPRAFLVVIYRHIQAPTCPDGWEGVPIGNGAKRCVYYQEIPPNVWDWWLKVLEARWKYDTQCDPRRNPTSYYQHEDGEYCVGMYHVKAPRGANLTRNPNFTLPPSQRFTIGGSGLMDISLDLVDMYTGPIFKIWVTGWLKNIPQWTQEGISELRQLMNNQVPTALNGRIRELFQKSPYNVPQPQLEAFLSSRSGGTGPNPPIGVPVPQPGPIIIPSPPTGPGTPPVIDVGYNPYQLDQQKILLIGGIALLALMGIILIASD